MSNKNIYTGLLIGIAIGIITSLLAVSFIDGRKDDKVNYSPEISHNVENQNGEDHDESVKLTETDMDELGIRLDTAGSRSLEMHTVLTGEIVIDPDKVAHITPRFNGIVKEVYKKIGDKVIKNEIIGIIESNESLMTYEVKSLIDGTVLDLHMTPGELIGDAGHVVTIADLNSVWAELKIYQKDLGKIKTGQTTRVFFENEPSSSVTGKVFYISPTVDENTRTATARVRINNVNGIWKPGTFVFAEVVTRNVDVSLAVTPNAIQNFEGRKVIFIKNGDVFRPQRVITGASNSEYVEVKEGIKAGQTYVAQGAFIIKSELLKESFGGGHSH